MDDEINIRRGNFIEEEWHVETGSLFRSYLVRSSGKVVSTIHWRDIQGNEHKLTNLDLRAILKILEIGKYKLE